MCLFLIKLYCFNITSPFCPFVCLFENQTHSLKSTNLRPVIKLKLLEWEEKGEGKLDWKSLISVIFID